MKLSVLSDTHMQHRRFAYLSDAFSHKLYAGGDVIIHCGDWSGYGILNELVDFARWMEQLPYTLRICVAGNHDLYTEEHPIETRNIFKEYGIHYLQDESITLPNGMNLYGSPWTPTFQNWAFMKAPRSLEMQQIWQKVPDNTDVLITHGPPYQLMDRVFRGENIGDAQLRTRIEELSNLQYHFFGHAHEGYGHMQYTTHKGNEVQMYNVALTDIRMVLTRPPIHLDLPDYEEPYLIPSLS